MKIGLIDSDLIGRKSQRFPNLALMKISTHFKLLKNKVVLLENYNNLDEFDNIIISKVFSDTKIPDLSKYNDKIVYGGTGFHYENAPFLPMDIEHSIPDYTLYNDFLTHSNIKNTKYFTDYSIGFITRGCFRKCEFCVNKRYDKTVYWSDIEEFICHIKPKICLLDDNFLAYGKHRDILYKLIDIKKPFQFKQGLDIRLLRYDTSEILSSCKYDGDFIFAFDNIKDYNKIEHKLQMWRSYTNKNTKFYVLTAYESQDMTDIKNMFSRIELLMKYNCIPYIMRYSSYKNSEFKEIYTNVARWCNQVQFYKKMSFKQFCMAHGANSKISKICNKYPELNNFFDMKFNKKG
jgi:hypothetical protein